MKMRKYIAILFITLANTLILAHVVTPHYHHNGVVCFEAEKTSCISESNHHGESHTGCDSEEDSSHHADLDDCDLHYLLKRTEILESEDLSPDLRNTNRFLAICLDCLYDHLAHSIQLEKKDRHNIFLSSNYISPYVGSHYGLRAPPFSNC